MSCEERGTVEDPTTASVYDGGRELGEWGEVAANGFITGFRVFFNENKVASFRANLLLESFDDDDISAHGLLLLRDRLK